MQAQLNHSPISHFGDRYGRKYQGSRNVSRDEAGFNLVGIKLRLKLELGPSLILKSPSFVAASQAQLLLKVAAMIIEW